MTVSDVEDGIDAINVTLTDELPGDRNWVISDPSISPV